MNCVSVEDNGIHQSLMRAAIAARQTFVSHAVVKCGRMPNKEHQGAKHELKSRCVFFESLCVVS